MPSGQWWNTCYVYSVGLFDKNFASWSNSSKMKEMFSGYFKRLLRFHQATVRVVQLKSVRNSVQSDCLLFKVPPLYFPSSISQVSGFRYAYIPVISCAYVYRCICVRNLILSTINVKVTVVITYDNHSVWSVNSKNNINKLKRKKLKKGNDHYRTVFSPENSWVSDRLSRRKRSYGTISPLKSATT